MDWTHCVTQSILGNKYHTEVACTTTSPRCKQSVADEREESLRRQHGRRTIALAQEALRVIMMTRRRPFFFPLSLKGQTNRKEKHGEQKTRQRNRKKKGCSFSPSLNAPSFIWFAWSSNVSATSPPPLPPHTPPIVVLLLRPTLLTRPAGFPNRREMHFVSAPSGVQSRRVDSADPSTGGSHPPFQVGITALSRMRTKKQRNGIPPPPPLVCPFPRHPHRQAVPTVDAQTKPRCFQVARNSRNSLPLGQKPVESIREFFTQHLVNRNLCPEVTECFEVSGRTTSNLAQTQHELQRQMIVMKQYDLLKERSKASSCGNPRGLRGT